MAPNSKACNLEKPPHVHVHVHTLIAKFAHPEPQECWIAGAGGDRAVGCPDSGKGLKGQLSWEMPTFWQNLSDGS